MIILKLLSIWMVTQTIHCTTEGSEEGSAGIVRKYTNLRVKRARRAEIHMGGKTYVERGEKILLSCNATGPVRPPDDVDWFKDGNKIRPNAQKGVFITKYRSPETRTLYSELNVDHSRLEDAGTYACRSTDREVTSLQLIVLNERARIIKTETDTEPVEGRNVKLICVAVGNPTPVVKWYKWEFSGSDRFLGSGNHTIYNINRKDSGEYLCRANNRVGPGTMQTMSLWVEFAPHMKLQLVDTYSGAKAVECTVTSWPSAEMNVTFNGGPMSKVIGDRPVSGYLRGSEQVKGYEIGETVNKNNSGVYTCLAVNKHGMADAFLSVSMDTSTAPKSENAGEKKCNLADLMKCSENFDFMKASSSELSPKERCHAATELVDCVTPLVKICSDILQGPIDVSMSMKKLACKEELTGFTDYDQVNKSEISDSISRISVDVNETRSTGIRLTWRYGETFGRARFQKVTYRRSVDEATNTIKLLDGDRDVLIEDLFPDTYYRLKVFADGAYGTVSVKTKPLDDPEPAKIIRPRALERSIVAREGKPVSMYCEVSGSPQPEVTWLRKNRRPIKAGRPGFRITNSTGFRSVRSLLTISSVRYKRDNGPIYCMTHNGRPQPTKVIYQLKVKKIRKGGDFPTMVKEPDFTEVVEGSKTNVECRARFPAHDTGMYITWWKDGTPVDPILHLRRVLVTQDEPLEDGQTLFGSRLEIMYTTPSDSGLYSCVANSTNGWVQSKSARLQVTVPRVPPFITEAPQNLTVEAGYPFNLTCAAGGNPPPKISWYRRDSSVVIPDGFVRNVLPVYGINQTESYVCVVYSNLGRIERNVTVTVSDQHTGGIGYNESSWTSRNGTAYNASVLTPSGSEPDTDKEMMSLPANLDVLVEKINRALSKIRANGTHSPVILNVLNINMKDGDDTGCSDEEDD